MKRILCGLLLASALFALPAVAQNVFPTPDTTTTVGVVSMCLDVTGKAVPMSNGACANPVQVSGTFTASTGPSTTDGTGNQLPTASGVPYTISRNYIWNPSEGAWDQAQAFSGAGPTNVGPTNCSGTITLGGTAQNAFGAQTSLHGFRIDNLSTDPMWISFVGSAAVGASGSILLAAGSTTVAGGSYSAPFGFGTNAAVSVIAATTADKFSCVWW